MCQDIPQDRYVVTSFPNVKMIIFQYYVKHDEICANLHTLAHTSLTSTLRSYTFSYCFYSGNYIVFLYVDSTLSVPCRHFRVYDKHDAFWRNDFVFFYLFWYLGNNFIRYIIFTFALPSWSCAWNYTVYIII